MYGFVDGFAGGDPYAAADPSGLQGQGMQLELGTGKVIGAAGQAYKLDRKVFSRLYGWLTVEGTLKGLCGGGVDPPNKERLGDLGGQLQRGDDRVRCFARNLGHGEHLVRY